MTLLFRYAEELIPLISKYGGFGGANAHLFEEISWPHFWVVQMWLIAAMVAFCSIGEIIQTFGVKRLFFARRPE
jgi:hypothetical protein